MNLKQKMGGNFFETQETHKFFIPFRRNSSHQTQAKKVVRLPFESARWWCWWGEMKASWGSSAVAAASLAPFFFFNLPPNPSRNPNSHSEKWKIPSLRGPDLPISEIKARERWGDGDTFLGRVVFVRFLNLERECSFWTEEVFRYFYEQFLSIKS